MDDIRKLVYCDKPNLKSFAVNEIAHLNKLIYESWLVKRTEIDPFDPNYFAYYLKAFNDAYYICTLALLLPQGLHLHLHSLKTQVDRPSVVFPMVYLYLTHLTKLSRGIKFLIHNLETKFKIDSDWGQNFNELQEATCGYTGNIDPAIFAQRELTKEILSEIKWGQLTGTFKKERIREVVRSYARNNENWSMMCDAIKDAAVAYDYDFGFVDYEQEGFDEDGVPYSQTITVPKKPYDDYGEEILEPLKRAGVYEFCDDLKQKFDELAVASQSLDIDDDSQFANKTRLNSIPDKNRETNVRRGRQKVAQNTRGTFRIVCNYSNLNSRLNLFYLELKSKAFIDGKTDQRIFIDMFKGVLSNEKIVWTGKLKDLHYLFIKLDRMKVLEKKPTSIGLWQAVCSCFLLKKTNKDKGYNTNEYNYELCEIKTSQFNNGGKIPDTDEELDNIIAFLDPKLNEFNAIETQNSKGEIQDMFDDYEIIGAGKG